MNRRTFLEWAAGIVFCTALPPVSEAQTIDECNTTGTVCRAGITLSNALLAYAAQQMPLWCWAASIEMIFRAHGYYVPQADIVRAVYGDVVNLPAFSGYSMSTQLNRDWTDSQGRRFRVALSGLYDFDARAFNLSHSQVIGALKAGNPLLYANLSHAMMLGIVDYYPASPEPGFRAFGFADPWPGNGLRGATDNREMVAMHRGGHLRYLALPVITPI